jgi:hypothetical protein
MRNWEAKWRLAGWKAAAASLGPEMGKAAPDNGQIESCEPANRRSAQLSGYAAESSSTQSTCIDLVRTDDNPTGVLRIIWYVC